MFKLANRAVAWERKKQGCVALSTTEAEYVSLAAGAKKSILLSRIRKEILGKKCIKILGSDMVHICNDDQSAVKNANCGDIKERSKHIEVRHNFVKRALAEGKIIIDFMPTKNMVADVLPNGLNNVKHWNCINQ